MKSDKLLAALNKENKSKSLRIIQTNFKEYKNFMDCPDLILPKPCFFNILLNNNSLLCGGKTIAKVVYPKNEKDKTKFCIDSGILLTYDVNAKALLAHDFTHLLDYQIFAPIFKHDKKWQNQKIKTPISMISNYIKLYSEFHSTLVQLKIGSGFKHNNENKKISLSDEININLKSTTLGEYIENLTASYKNDFTKAYAKFFVSKRTKENLEAFFNHIWTFAMYYHATLHFLEKYCIDDFSKLVDASMFAGFFECKGFDDIIKLFTEEKNPISADALAISYALYSYIFSYYYVKEVLQFGGK